MTMHFQEKDLKKNWNVAWFEFPEFQEPPRGATKDQIVWEDEQRTTALSTPDPGFRVNLDWKDERPREIVVYPRVIESSMHDPAMRITVPDSGNGTHFFVKLLAVHGDLSEGGAGEERFLRLDFIVLWKDK